MSFTSFGATERLVLDLWDAGNGSRAIARETGLSEDRARQIISTYAGGPERGQEAGIRRSTIALLDAIRTHHPERCALAMAEAA